MLKSYIFIRWVIFLFLITPILFAIVATGVSTLFEELNIYFPESYIFLLAPFIYFFTIRYLWRVKYDYSQENKLSKKFKNALFILYFAIFMLFAVALAVSQVNVLAFFAGPVLILVFVMLVYGCDLARNELKSLKNE